MSTRRQPLVSVIIGTYNSAPTIGACLQSVFAQEYKNIEVIVVDKSSTDDTVARAKKYPVKVMRGERERCTQWNAGARAARGKYLYFLGADMEDHPKFIRSAVAACEREGAAAIYTLVVTRSDSYWGRVRGLEREFYLHDTRWQAARFLERAAFFRVGGWNERLVAAEDWDLQDRLDAAGVKTASAGPYPEVHLDEPDSLLVLAKKFYYYGGTMRGWVQAHRLGDSIGRFQPVRPVFWAHPELFARHWTLVPGFVVYKLVQYGCSALGYLFYRPPKKA